MTGGAGFIGSHLAERLLGRGFNVTVLDDLSAGKSRNLATMRKEERFRFLKGDVSKPRTLARAVKGVDAVFHQAAISSFLRSTRNPQRTVEVNVTGTLNVFEASRRADVSKVVFASSAAVYGSKARTPCSEMETPSPSSHYGVTKLAAENYCKMYQDAYGLKTVVLRYFNVYGPRQRADLEGGVVSIFISRLERGKPPLIYGDGRQTRDFIHVNDVVEANLRALQTAVAEENVFNVGTGHPTSIIELAKLTAHLTGRSDLEPVFTTPREGDVRESFGEVSRTERILGFSPQISLQEGLRGLLR